MTFTTIKDYAKMYNNAELFDALNNTFKGINAHCYKQGNNVRLFTDDVATRAEIWKTSKGYDMYIGKDTTLYGIASSWIAGEYASPANLKYSKSNELALKELTASDVNMILNKLERVPEKTTAKRGKGKGKKADNAKAV